MKIKMEEVEILIERLVYVDKQYRAGSISNEERWNKTKDLLLQAGIEVE